MVFNGKLKFRARLAKQAAVTLGDMHMETKPSKAFASIKQSLDEALKFMKESESKAVVHNFSEAEKVATIKNFTPHEKGNDS